MANDKDRGLLEYEPSGNDRIYFGVEVDPQRAEYLAKALDVPLCTGCGREEAECSADPCQGVMADRGDPQCYDCREYFYAARLRNGRCPACDSVRLDKIINLFHAQNGCEGIDLNHNYEVDDRSDPEVNGAWIAAWVFVDFKGTELDSGQGPQEDIDSASR